MIHIEYERPAGVLREHRLKLFRSLVCRFPIVHVFESYMEPGLRKNVHIGDLVGVDRHKVCEEFPIEPMEAIEYLFRFVVRAVVELRRVDAYILEIVFGDVIRGERSEFFGFEEVHPKAVDLDRAAAGTGDCGKLLLEREPAFMQTSGRKTKL